MKPKKMLAIRKTETDLLVRDRIMLNVLVIRDKMSISKAAYHLGMVPSWGVKWRQRYEKDGVNGLQTRSRSGRSPRVSRDALKEVKKDQRDNLRGCHGRAGSHTERVLDRVPDRVFTAMRPQDAALMGIHQKGSCGKVRPEGKPPKDRLVQKEAQKTDRVQEARWLHDMRLGRVNRDCRGPASKGRLHPKGRAATCTYTGAHSKTIVFGLII